MTELPFAVEKDAELLKNSGWLIGQARELRAAIKDRNEIIHMGWRTTTEVGGLSSSILDQILQRQTSISEAECLLSSQLMDLTLDTIRRLEKVNDTYRVVAKKSRANISDKAQRTMAALRKLSNRSEENPFL